MGSDSASKKIGHGAGDAARYGRATPFGIAVGGMLATAVGLGVGRFVYTPILPSMVEELGLTKTAAGLLASANFIGYLVGALAAAAPNLPGSRRVWFLGGLAVVAATLAGMSAGDNTLVLFCLRFLCGAASAFVLVFGSAIVLESLNALRAPALAALHFGGVGLGITATAIGISWLHARGVGWRGQWLTAGAVCAAAWPFAAVLVREREGTAGSPAAKRKTMPGLRSFAIAYALCGFGYSITATFIVTMARSTPDAPRLEQAAWLCVGLAALPSVWLWGKAGRVVGPHQAMALASLLQAVGIAAGVSFPGASGLLASGLLVGATFMGITALGFAVAQDLAPDIRRRVTALLTAAFGVGQIVGPALAGFLADRTGSFLVPSVLAAGALIAGAWFSWVGRD